MTCEVTGQVRSWPCHHHVMYYNEYGRENIVFVAHLLKS